MESDGGEPVSLFGHTPPHRLHRLMSGGIGCDEDGHQLPHESDSSSQLFSPLIFILLLVCPSLFKKGGSTDIAKAHIPPWRSVIRTCLFLHRSVTYVPIFVSFFLVDQDEHGTGSTRAVPESARRREAVWTDMEETIVATVGCRRRRQPQRSLTSSSTTITNLASSSSSSSSSL